MLAATVLAEAEVEAEAVQVQSVVLDLAQLEAMAVLALFPLFLELACIMAAVVEEMQTVLEVLVAVAIGVLVGLLTQAAEVVLGTELEHLVLAVQAS